MDCSRLVISYRILNLVCANLCGLRSISLGLLRGGVCGGVMKSLFSDRRLARVGVPGGVTGGVGCGLSVGIPLAPARSRRLSKGLPPLGEPVTP